MSLYSLSDEHALQSEVPLPGFLEGHGVYGSQDLCQNIGDLIYSEHPDLDLDPSLHSTDVAGDTMQDNLNKLSLYAMRESESSRIREDSSDSDSMLSLQELGLMCPKAPEESDSATTKSSTNGSHKGKCPQTPMPECGLCGKVFGSASSLSKHCLTHSQERVHVCKVCSKAFKRQDHLTGHMLTHLKTKPFMCIEQGCSKSYCDYRSLRRHYEVQHGLCSLKGASPRESPRHEGLQKHAQAEQSKLTLQSKREDPSSSKSLLPSRDLLRCLVTSIVQQKLAPSVGASEEQTNSRNSAQLCHVSESSVSKVKSQNYDVLRECTSFQSNSTSSSTYTLINTANVVKKDATNTDSLPHAEEDSLRLDLWPSGALTGLPIFGSQKIQSTQNFWVRSTVPGSIAVMKEQSTDCRPMDICLGALNELNSTGVLPPLKVSGDTSLWQHFGEQSQQTPPGESTFQHDSEFRKVVLQAQGSSATQEQIPAQQHLFHMISKSHHSISHNQIKTQPNGAIPQSLQRPAEMVVQPSTDFIKCEAQDDSKKTTESQRNPTFGQELASSSRSTCTSDAGILSGLIRLPKSFVSLGSLVGYGNQKDGIDPQPGKALTPDDVASFFCSAGKSQAKNTTDKTQSRLGRPRRTSTSLKDKLKFNLSSAASPSQVALESFCIPSASFDTGNSVKSKLTIFNRIQGGNIYHLSSNVKEEDVSDCDRAISSSFEGNKCERSYRCRDCGQLFHTESGLRHLCSQSNPWPSHTLQQDEQAIEADGPQTPERTPDPQRDPLMSPPSLPPSGDAASGPLVIPVSVPVMMTKQQKKIRASERGSLLETPHPKRGKKRPGIKALLIPPPLVEMHPTPSGCFLSHLRSPTTYLSEHLLNGLFRYPPYTPPPMLSPIREGTGLYFSTICPSSTNACANRVACNVPDEDRLISGIRLVKDDMVLTIEPHINIGDRFQAKIPELLDRSLLDREEHRACLVWKPWGDTKQVTQSRVSQFLNLACSSAMPGGGTNLELALHCLHSTQGKIMEALDKLLVTGPQKALPRSLADYHYAGSDFWTVPEKRLFKRVYCAHRKDFSLIQSLIHMKNVYQCVEYYYTWKKIIKFDRSRVQEKKARKEQSGVTEAPGEMKAEPISEITGTKHPNSEAKVNIKRQKTQGLKHSSPFNQQDRSNGAAQPGEFACKECDRVFDKVKSRNAHMKRHRQQDHADTLSKAKWVPKHPKIVKENFEDTVIPLPGSSILPETSLKHWLGFNSY